MENMVVDVSVMQEFRGDVVVVIFSHCITSVSALSVVRYLSVDLSRRYRENRFSHIEMGSTQ